MPASPVRIRIGVLTLETRKAPLGKFARLALKYRAGGFLRPRARSCSSLAAGGNRLTRLKGPPRSGRASLVSPIDGDAMINDAGKHGVKAGNGAAAAGMT